MAEPLSSGPRSWRTARRRSRTRATPAARRARAARDLGRPARLAAADGAARVQAARADGFPWSTWAGSLNLFVWLVVGAYLIWGCRPRYRLLGLAVMPLAALLLVLPGRAAAPAPRAQPLLDTFLVLHVGLVLVAFAGFTLAAALCGPLSLAGAAAETPRDADPRLRAPSLVTLESLAVRVGRGLAARAHPRRRGRPRAPARAGRRLRRADGRDPAHLVDLRRVPRCAALPWAPGRRAAYVVLAGFALVAVARLGLPLTHFS